MSTCIEVVFCQLLGITLSSDHLHILDNNIPHAELDSVKQNNELLSDSDVNMCLALLNTFCKDEYGSSLWCFSSKAVDHSMLHGEKLSIEFSAYQILQIASYTLPWINIE